MSYILDALRKSDQQRRRGAAPTLLPLQPEAAPPKRPLLFAYAALAVVLLGAGIGIGWLHPWQPQRAAPAPETVAVQPPAPAQLPAPVPGAAPRLQPELPAQNAVAATQTAPAPAPAPAAAPAAAPAPSPAQPAAEVKSAGGSAPPKAVADAARKAALPERIPGVAGGAGAQVSPVVAINDLPVAIQQELPPMSVSVHAYAGIAAQRLVGINNRLLHEGDEVAPGLRLEQITPNGMILSYKGYSFRRSVH